MHTLERTIHTGCPIKVGTRDGNYGRCESHLVRVYRDGHDWHLLQTYDLDAIKVLDDTKDVFQQRVTVSAPRWATDDDLAEVAGFDGRHFHGVSVTRYADGTASVSMWRD